MMESLAQLEVLCERLYNSQDSVERAHAERTLKCFSANVDYIPQCQYILDNALTPYALMLASSSLLKQVTEHSLSLQLRLDIRNFLFWSFFLFGRQMFLKCVNDSFTIIVPFNFICCVASTSHVNLANAILGHSFWEIKCASSYNFV